MGDKEKLFEILQENDIRISKKGNICLNDFVENIVKSKNPKLYIKKLNNYDKISIKNILYIKPDDCIDILRNTKFKKCKDIYTKIQVDDDDDDSSIIDIDEQIFQFEGHKFLAFFINKDDNGDWDVWVKASQVAKYLGYHNPSEAINDNVEFLNIIRYSDLYKLYPIVNKQHTKFIDNKTIFINYSGLSQLIALSKKPKSIRLANFLNINLIIKKVYHESKIMECLIDFFDSSGIKYIHPSSIKNNNGTKYFIDCYLPQYKIAIEIDENDHRDRDPKYEIKREQFIKKKLNCVFVRCNPDDPKFSIYKFIGKINNQILNLSFNK